MKNRITLLPAAFGLLLLAPTASWAQDSAEASFHDSVVVVLDASGSMEDLIGPNLTRMEAAKTALKTVLKSVPKSTHVGILVFSAWVDEPWIGSLESRESNESLFVKINAIRPGGGTPLGGYIKFGADRLLRDREKQFGYGSYRLLVVTDGQAEDEDLMNRYAPDVISRGITMDVIGVDMQQDHILATHARSYRRADDAESLTKAVSEVFAEVASSDQSTGLEDDSFELIAGLEAEMAVEIIGALANSGNHPIGEMLEGEEEAQPEESDPVADTSEEDAEVIAGCVDGFLGFAFPVILFLFCFSWFRKKMNG